ncbi:SAM-dependent methyltransferase [Phycicoccus sp. CSK15P-2]|uniref:SAM-dependent methyltransferase n=1 Tax=Phycicoccus sp. CSK15P-2 TaxID=2807627 RepID=UPI00195195B2|nr:SAM-dependent methyltransferase [Phycicoccus sp. CSK15P-2]MBM6405565.1 SAM-dependent methyltransferase [Phycicoccus sp. CSK15P-2]
MAEPLPWRDAWHVALYGPEGFYRAADGPAGHFATAAQGPLGEVLAEALGGLADREGAVHVVDVGAGRGELLTALRAARPDLGLTGVDVVERPGALPDDIAWLRSPGGAGLPGALTDLEDVLVVANEWLDVVPCTVARVEGGRLVALLVDPVTGAETPGPPLGADDAAWCAAHWPADDLPDGARVEVGLARDRAWDDLVGRVRRGTVVAADYGHTRGNRPPGGSLVAYRAGTLVDPVPDGGCDLTAHVAVDSLTADTVTTQADALRGLGVDAARPSVEDARTDPAGYLAALSRASAAASLLDPRGFGGFAWVARRVGAADWRT